MLSDGPLEPTLEPQTPTLPAVLQTFTKIVYRGECLTHHAAGIKIRLAVPRYDRTTALSNWRTWRTGVGADCKWRW